MAVVQARIVLLHGRIGKPLARLQEELVHGHIWRELSPAHGLGIGQIRPASEQPFDERLGKAALEIALILRPYQRQAGENTQAQSAIGVGQRIERIHQKVRLADTDRNSQHQVAPHLIDDRLGAARGVVISTRQLIGFPVCSLQLNVRKRGTFHHTPSDNPRLDRSCRGTSSTRKPCTRARAAAETLSRPEGTSARPAPQPCPRTSDAAAQDRDMSR